MTVWMKRACIILLVFLLSSAVIHGKTVIKMATLAPSDSTWVNMMRQMFKEVEDKSKGEIEFKLYPGGGNKTPNKKFWFPTGRYSVAGMSR